MFLAGYHERGFLMKKTFLFLMLVISLFTLSCGGSGSSSGGGTSPTLTLLNFTASVPQGQSARVDFRYSDPEGDIRFLFVREQFSQDLTTTFAAQDLNISGSSGSAFFLVVFPNTDAQGQHLFEVSAVDANGNRSNLLSFTINVT